MNKILVCDTKIGSSYINGEVRVKVISKVSYGATLEEEKTGKIYMVSPNDELTMDVDSEVDKVETKEEVETTPVKKRIPSGVMKLIEHIVFTAPSTGVSIHYIISKIREELNIDTPDSKIRNLVYTRVWHLTKNKGYKNISTTHRYYALRKEEDELMVCKKNDNYGYDKELFTDAKDADITSTYHSPKGIPCKVLSKNEDGVTLKNCITGEQVLVENDFPLIPEERILETLRDTKKTKRGV